MNALSLYSARLLAAATIFTAAGFARASDSNGCMDVAASVPSAAYQTATVDANDGVCLRSFSWKPAQPHARGVVVIVHGIRDYALRYENFAQELTQHGFAVYAQDLRGHAYSGGPRQRFDSMEQMVGDIDLIVQKARQENPGVPLFIYGHSLGGLITTEYALDHSDRVSGIVLSAAALQRPHSVSGIEVGFARMLAALAPGAHVVAVDDHEFARDKAVIASLADDPLITHDKLPAISAVASINGMASVQTNMGKLDAPLLVLYGTSDKVNPTEGSQALYSAANSPDKTVKVYEGAYHDLMHEPERAQITADVVAWLTARVSDR